MQTEQIEYLTHFIEQYTAKTACSKQRAQEARSYLADSRGVAGFRMQTKEMLYPIVGKRAQGARFWDLDNNEYIDLAMGFGSLIFGHMPDFLKTAIGDYLNEGAQLGPQADRVHEVAKIICELAHVERVAFCNTGTEAIMVAIRLARLRTGRQKIAMFSGAYHGMYDLALGQTSISPIGIAKPMTAGLPDYLFNDVLILDYRSDEALASLRQYSDDLAAIIIEPVRGRFPHEPAGDYLKKLRKFADEVGAALIFDEIVTGFRSKLGGGQAYFGVQADIAVYGKAIGGGLPIGVIAGKEQYLSGIDGGSWNYDDMSYPKEETTFFAGTFNKNPLSMVAAHAVLTRLQSEGEELQQSLSDKTTRLAQTLNDFFQSNALSLRIRNFSSLFRIDLKQNLDIFNYHLVFNNVYVWEGGNLYLSAAHTDDDVDYVIENIKQTAITLKQYKFIK